MKFIPEELLEKIQKNNFLARDRVRGKEIFEARGKMQLPRLSDKGDFIMISAQIMGTQLYETTIQLHKFNSLATKITCTCPVRSNCKHGAALTYYLLENLDVFDAIEGQELPASARVVKEKGYFVLDKSKSLYEHLSVSGSESRGRDNGKFVIQLTPQNTLDVRYVSIFDKAKDFSGYWDSFSVMNRFTVRYSDTHIYLKCDDCQIKKENGKLCSHTTKLLYHFVLHEFQYRKYFNGELTYEELMNQASERTKLSPEKLKKAYDIEIKGDSFVLIERIPNYLIGDKLKQFQDDVKRLTVVTNDEQTLKKLENQQGMMNAFFWEVNVDTDDGIFTVLSGKPNKAKDKLVSFIEVVDVPLHLNQEQQHLYQQLRAAIGYSPEDLDFYALRDLLLSDEFRNSKIPQYYGESSTYSIGKSDLNSFQIGNGTLFSRLIVEEHELGYALKHELWLDDKHELKSWEIEKVNPYFVIDQQFAYPFEEAVSFQLIKLFVDANQIFIDRDDREYLDNILTSLGDLVRITKKIKDSVSVIIPQGGKRRLSLRRVGDFILFEPSLHFGDVVFNAFHPQSMMLNGQKFSCPEEERASYLDFIKTLHPNFSKGNSANSFVFLKIEEVLQKLWFLNLYEQCNAHEVEVLGQENIKEINFSSHKAKISSYIKSGIDWFDVDLEIKFGDEVINHGVWMDAIKRNEKFIKLGNGQLGILPEEWLKKLKKISQNAEISRSGIKISKFRFNILEDLFDEIDNEELQQELSEKRRRLLQIETNKVYELPDSLHVELRPYQLHGYQWLRMLNEVGWGGILADDMGLGKTLQVISLLAHVKTIPMHRASLIVVPRSLIFNWRNEIEKFCPSLTYCIHHGVDRTTHVDPFYDVDLVITTYTLMVNDIQLLRDFRFEYIILDESQAIKNIGSQRYKAANLLNAKNRICMTGTPIENNTFELFAQMNFLNPGMLGSQKSFKDNFSVPIDTLQDVETSRSLKRLIHPFLLRRTKEIVAQDLPEKTESVIYCEMGPRQRKLYDQLKDKIKQDVGAKLEADGLNESRFFILEGLLRLRQMCNSPQLLDKTLSEKLEDSVKIETLVQLLTEELNNHNALVFSQFVSMLELIRVELDKLGIPYAYLDGSTKNREEAVRYFQEEEGIKIFLISLKAGNVGLNLVKADYVYIVDPWWNPAVEAQAIDRVHRIGQDKNIFAYKLVCKDTIEEKIVELQRKKKLVSDDIISVDENVFKSLERDEILALFD